MSVELGKRIKGLRRLKGFTQQELAERINVSVSSLSNMERGIRKPKPFLLENIARALDVPPEELFLVRTEQDNLSETGSGDH